MHYIFITKHFCLHVGQMAQPSLGENMHVCKDRAIHVLLKKNKKKRKKTTDQPDIKHFAYTGLTYYIHFVPSLSPPQLQRTPGSLLPSLFPPYGCNHHSCCGQ